MKTTRTVLCALLLLGAIPMAASAQLSVGGGISFGSHGRASVDLGFFYDSLASYGNWIERPSYGWVWTPRAVSASWRPYQAGHWVWSDEGWTWLSDEPYGWATYHYGRWYQDPEIGWAWVPGNDWGPAWVSWQEGEDYVGWAPLPPGANVAASYNGGGYDGGYGYDDGYGYDNGYDGGYGYDDSYSYGGGYGGGYGYYDGGYGYGGGYAYGIAPSAYLFVPVRSFLSVSLFDFYVPWVRVSSFWGHTRNCTYYGYRGGHYFNRGVSFDHVRRYYHNVPRYQLSELNGFRDRGHRIDGNRISFFRPQVQRTRGITPLDRPNARRSVMRADQFRSAFPDRVNRAQRESRQGFRAGEIQGASPRQRDWQRGQDRTGRQQVLDYGQRQQRFQQGQGQADGRYRNQIDRQQQYDTLRRNREQVDRQRQYDVPRNQDRGYQQRNQEQVYRQQRQYDNQQRWQQNQAERQQRQYDNQQRWQQQRQYNAPRVQERGYQRQNDNNNQRWQRQAPPQRENRNESRGQGNNGRGRGQGQDNGRRHGGRGGQ